MNYRKRVAGALVSRRAILAVPPVAVLASVAAPAGAASAAPRAECLADLQGRA